MHLVPVVPANALNRPDALNSPDALHRLDALSRTGALNWPDPVNRPDALNRSVHDPVGFDTSNHSLHLLQTHASGGATIT